MIVDNATRGSREGKFFISCLTFSSLFNKLDQLLYLHHCLLIHYSCFCFRPNPKYRATFIALIKKKLVRFSISDPYVRIRDGQLRESSALYAS